MNQEPGIFDPTQFPPATGTVPGLPISDSNGHVVQIVSSEMAMTRAGDGSYLALTMQILEGPHKGQTGVERLNLGNANPQTVEIAARQLSAYCAVCGVAQAFNYQNNCSILYHKPFRCIVGQQKGDSGYTEVREVRFLDGRKANQGGATQASAPPQFPQPTMPQQAPQQPQQWQQPGFNQAPQQPQQPQPQQQQPQQPLMQPPQPQQAAMPWNQAPPNGS